MTNSQNQSLKYHISQFIHFIKIIKQSSVHTVASYQTDLLQYSSFIVKRYDAKDPSLDNFHRNSIRGYLSQLVNHGYSARSVARKLAALRSFSKYLLRESIIEKNPTHNISTPKLDKRLPVYLNKNEMKNLLELPNTLEITGIRDLLILKLFYKI